MDEDAKLDVDAAKAENPRRIELKILKNRNGPTGKKTHFLYSPKCNLFRGFEYKKKRDDDEPYFFFKKFAKDYLDKINQSQVDEPESTEPGLLSSILLKNLSFHLSEVIIDIINAGLETVRH